MSGVRAGIYLFLILVVQVKNLFFVGWERVFVAVLSDVVLIQKFQ